MSQSRWGVLDFDAHDGNDKRAKDLAFSAFRSLMNHKDLFVIFESSGRGWHLWIISKEFHHIHEWREFLTSVAHHCEIPIKAGICEIGDVPKEIYNDLRNKKNG